MTRASDRNANDGTAKKRKSGKSGKSNWQKFNYERDRKKKIDAGLIPAHRLHGKQPALAKKRSGRVVQRAIRIESPSPVRAKRSGRVVQKAIRIEEPSPVRAQKSGRGVQRASRIECQGHVMEQEYDAQYDADDEQESVRDAESPSSEEEAVEEDNDNGNCP